MWGWFVVDCGATDERGCEAHARPTTRKPMMKLKRGGGGSEISGLVSIMSAVKCRRWFTCRGLGVLECSCPIQRREILACPGHVFIVMNVHLVCVPHN